MQKHNNFDKNINFECFELMKYKKNVKMQGKYPIWESERTLQETYTVCVFDLGHQNAKTHK